MSKKRKKTNQKKSNKCPEPINTMLDLTAGAAMAFIAAGEDEKHKYTERGRINPYAVASFDLATGRVKSSEDILRTTFIMGLAGSFDEEPQEIPFDDSVVLGSESSIIHPVSKGTWRDYCMDGSEYGLDPEDFDSADDYNDALNKAKSHVNEVNHESLESHKTVNKSNQCDYEDKKYRWRKYCEDGSEYGIFPEKYETADDYAEALEIAKRNLKI